MIHFPSINNNVVVIALSLLILQTVLIDISTVKGAPNTTPLEVNCGTGGISVGQYAELVEKMLNDLAAQCALTPDYEMSVEYGHEGIMAYGFVMCEDDLYEEDCTACLAHAQEKVLTDCPFAIDAWVKLEDCFIRYASNPFP